MARNFSHDKIRARNVDRSRLVLQTKSSFKMAPRSIENVDAGISAALAFLPTLLNSGTVLPMIGISSFFSKFG